MYQLQQTDAFRKWLKGLRDNTAKARIIARLDAARFGNLGDCKSVGSGIREMRVHVGAGYRVYFVERREALLILLCGGSKSSQARDIAKARRIIKEVEAP